jgi:hypothetical protein
MCAHQHGGGGRVATLDCLDQVPMIVDHAVVVFGIHAVALPKRRYEQQMTVNERERTGISGRLVDDPMKAPVGARHLDIRASRDQGFELFLGGDELSDMRLGAPLAGAARQHCLDRAAQIEQVFDKVEMDRPHARPAVSLDDDETLAMQLPQSLSDRHVADAVAGGEFVDSQSGTKGQAAGHDLVAESDLYVRVNFHLIEYLSKSGSYCRAIYGLYCGMLASLIKSFLQIVAKLDPACQRLA